MPPGPFIILSEVDSTNNYAMAKLHAFGIQAGSCFQAVEQTAGKGQRGRRWEAAKGDNITMSVCLKPVRTEFPFLLSAAMALGCYDFIKECGIQDIAVKWPNDVYIGDRKAAGILIENIVRGGRWEWSVVGVGVNVNQLGFGDLEHKAASLRQVLGETSAGPLAPFDVTALAKRLHLHLLSRLDWMRAQTAREIMDGYNEVLYLKNREVRLKRGSALFRTVIGRVNKSGELITYDTIERRFMVGEIEFANIE